MSPTGFSGKHGMSLGMAALSAAVVLKAVQWPLKTALFPIVIGASVFIMSTTELLISLFEKEGAQKHSALDFKFSEGGDKAIAARRTLIIFAWILGLFLMIFFFGFDIAVPLFVLLYLRLQGRENWTLTLAMTAGTWFVFWGLFVYLLGTSMPPGWIVRIVQG